jgi:hypothetical protein
MAHNTPANTMSIDEITAVNDRKKSNSINEVSSNEATNINFISYLMLSDKRERIKGKPE